MPYPDRFYPVVDSLAWVERLTKLGVGTIQLRAKNLNDAEALQITTDALEITKATRTKLIVNDYWRAAIVAGAKYLHLGQEDLAGADLDAIREAGLLLGISTHDDEELAAALAARPDYIALGPIFPTTLKAMRFAPQGISKVTEWKRRVGDIPLVAIGGIKLEQAAEIFAAGADSIAVVSDITQNADPDARVRAWLEGAERQYSILENPRQHNGTIHLLSCSEHRFGSQPRKEEAARWHGPFDRNEAFGAVERFQKTGIDVQPCEICNP